jgi:hypothetical protein
LCALILIGVSVSDSHARPVPRTKKGGDNTPQRFFRQTNNYSNMFFYLTNKGVLFNSGQGQAEGLFWPRGSSNAYIFGEGLWFATKKEIQGRKQKLCELGYNPNSGAGWYSPGEINDADNGSNYDSKYISYLSSRYDKYSGHFVGAPSPYVPDRNINWPIWDTSASKTIKRNFYFGDYVSAVGDRDAAKLTALIKPAGKTAVPAMLSQEDIVNIYTDADISANPEYRPAAGYPFNLNFQEVVYSWSFGKFRDMVFVRHKVTNMSTTETLNECFVAPAFDPDLGDPSNDHNTFLADADSTTTKTNVGLAEPYRSHPSLLNMGYQWSGQENGQEYGQVGFAFLESPVVNPSNGQIIENSDSANHNGYGPQGYQQLGLTTFQKWTIQNDPSTQDLRYDFVSSGVHNTDKTTAGDMRLLFATGPFTLPPGKSVETTIAIGIALSSSKNQQTNTDSLIRLMAFAQQVFNNPVVKTAKDSVGNLDTVSYVVNHFLAPVPPEVPNLHTQSLDKAILVTWDSVADLSVDPLNIGASATLNFMGYQLYRTTRSDHDSTIRPDGVNPVVKLGEWSLYDLRQDTLFDAKGKVKGFKYTRTNKTPHAIPHSYLDVGDDNHDGTLLASENLINGVKYYYYLIAYDEYDSVNNVGPLYTAIVPPKNFVSEMPTKPPFVNVPVNLQLSDLGCAGAGIKALSIEIADTGKFVQLFSNDTIGFTFQPRWTEYTPTFLHQSPLQIYVDLNELRKDTADYIIDKIVAGVTVHDTIHRRGNEHITYEKNFNPNASPVIIPYNFASGLVEQVPGQQTDSTFSGRFSTDNTTFAPYELVDQSFRVLVDYTFTQLKAPYRVKSIGFNTPSGANAANIVRLSNRTFHAPAGAALDFNNIDTSLTRPSFLGSLGEASYEISFGDPMQLSQADDEEFDTVSKSLVHVTSLVDPASKATFNPDVLPMTIVSKTHCNAPLQLIRPGKTNDITVELDCRYYTSGKCAANGFPSASDPDTMKVPIPGKFAVDAWHYADANQTSHSSPSFFQRTTSNLYYPNWGNGNNDGGKNKWHVAVHRIRLAGAEIILNAPGIQDAATTGDTTASAANQFADFKSGDKLTVEFSGQAKGVPFPGTQFTLYTGSANPTNFADASLYQGSILDQVQVVPNPYVVTHLGQTSTDNAKLYFTRLPPRCTIEIYSLAGDLIKTLEHNGYASSSVTTGIGTTTTSYDYSQLGDRAALEEWNLLSEGRQRIGSQVLIARIVAKDPNTLAIIGETTTKFAVVLGGFRIVR